MANLLGGLKSLRLSHQVLMGVIAALVLSLGLVFQGVAPAQATGNPYILIYKVDASVPPVLLAGATFRIIPNPAGACQNNFTGKGGPDPWIPGPGDFLDVTDNVFPYDEDPADGVIRLQDLIPGYTSVGPCNGGNGVHEYTISEITAPVGYDPDPVAQLIQYAGTPRGVVGTFVNHRKEKANPTISTTPSAGGVVGVTLNDTATLAGGNSPTGAVTFKLYSPADASCSGAASYTDADATAPYDTATSGGGFVSNAAGVWHWTADYAGDTNNNPASSGCAAEPVTVEKANPAISTTPSAGGVVGVTLNDTATLTGGNSPTGAVTFKLYPPTDATCSGAASYTDADATAPYATAPGFVSNAAGVWHWTADYSGDANNNPASSGCAAEPVTVISRALGKTQGFWGNSNGVARINGSGGYSVNAVAIGRGANIDTQAESLKVLPDTHNACGKGSPVIFSGQTATKDCSLASGINIGSLNNVSSQTLALGYNIKLVTGYTGKTIGALGCTPVSGLSLASTVNQVFTAAVGLINGSAALGSTTQAQLGAMDTLLGCLNREA